MNENGNGNNEQKEPLYERRIRRLKEMQYYAYSRQWTEKGDLCELQARKRKQQHKFI